MNEMSKLGELAGRLDRMFVSEAMTGEALRRRVASMGHADWELYYGDHVDARMRAASKKAAKSLNAALLKVFDALDKGMEPDAAYSKFFLPVAARNRNVGANDTEPRSVAKRLIGVYIDDDNWDW